jgi:hypothetical protein
MTAPQQLGGGQSPGGGLGGAPRGRVGFALLQVGPFALGPVGLIIPVIPSGHYGGPDQIGQVVLYNYSAFILQIYDTATGNRLDLQAWMGNVYDPPAGGAQLYARVAQGVPNPLDPNVLTGQLALFGEQIPGAWPIMLTSPNAGGGGGGPIIINAGPGVTVTSP